MTTLILIIVAAIIIQAVFREMREKVSGASHIATETVVQPIAEPQDWGPYAMPTFLRKEGAEATRVRRDLSEFRKEADTSQDGDWIDRLIRSQIADHGPA
jgi:hypothetical protein